jgi:hypothetical protein
MSQATFSQSEILGQLDDCALKFDFPMLDNGYIYPADVRLHAYADQTRWAIIIEALGYSWRGGDHGGIHNCLSYYGNCLGRNPGSANEDFLTVTADGPGEGTFEHEVNWYLREPKGQIYIRDQLVDFDCTREVLEERGLALMDTQASGTELLRSLLPKYRDLFLANENELRRQIPADLPCILILNEWNHPDLASDELPSANETFQLIASVLCRGDASVYEPTFPTNTHWSNWPEGGTM